MNSEIGQLLRNWRRRFEFSQQDLSLASGISARQISFIETGRSIPTPETVERLSTALKLSAGDQDYLVKLAGHSSINAMAEGDRASTLQMMIDAHNPYPAAVSDNTLVPLYLNEAALKFMGLLGIDQNSFTSIVDLIASPQIRPVLSSWNTSVTQLVKLVKMKSLTLEDNETFQKALACLLADDDIRAIWDAEQNFTGVIEPTIPLTLVYQGTEMHWLVVISTYGTPRNIEWKEYQLDFFYPMDDTARAFSENFLS